MPHRMPARREQPLRLTRVLRIVGERVDELHQPPSARHRQPHRGSTGHVLRRSDQVEPLAKLLEQRPHRQHDGLGSGAIAADQVVGVVRPAERLGDPHHRCRSAASGSRRPQPPARRLSCRCRSADRPGGVRYLAGHARSGCPAPPPGAHQSGPRARTEPASPAPRTPLPPQAADWLLGPGQRTRLAGHDPVRTERVRGPKEPAHGNQVEDPAAPDRQRNQHHQAVVVGSPMAAIICRSSAVVAMRSSHGR